MRRLALARIAGLRILIMADSALPLSPGAGRLRGFAIDAGSDADDTVPDFTVRLSAVAAPPRLSAMRAVGYDPNDSGSLDSLAEALTENMAGGSMRAATTDVPGMHFVWAVGYADAGIREAVGDGNKGKAADEIFRALYLSPAATTCIEYFWADAAAGGKVIDVRADSTGFDPVTPPFFFVMLSRMLMRSGGLLVHSSAVSLDGRGYLFTAVSGTGKSTMANLWRKAKGAAIINDDMIALRAVTGQGAGGNTETTVWAHNVPMSHYSDAPRSIPLAFIGFIEQSPNHWLSAVSPAEGALRLLCNTIHQTFDAGDAATYAGNAAAIASRTRQYRCGFKLSADIADFLLERSAKLAGESAVS